MNGSAANRCDIYRVARQCGVKLFDGHLHSPTSRKPFECYCKPTVREIGADHGEDHLKLVFMLMTGNKANAAELYADMLKAVSSLLARNPALLRSPSLVDDFNSIDLGSLRRKAKAMNCGIPTTHVLRVLIGIKFFQPLQGDLLDMIGEAA
ncbi:hypothetical protein TAL182_CH03019 [Rhizobium sp. TAL182]|uniref:hypothetical protein n=1 Tax=Rhizobium sp. TAL182 TaxID=2020313 RepID=UPI000A20FA1E|nr:hypothetical protein [Rhizobium sp. TAL182]ARO24764.1 hypothetical protein TAL182_CH03019 [Rhizobium sp. TAL182]